MSEPAWVLRRLFRFDLSRHRGVRMGSVVGRLYFSRGAVCELSVESSLVEPLDPRADRDFEICKPLPRAAIGVEGGGVAQELGLEEPIHRLGQRVGPLRQLHPNQLVRSGLFV